MSNLSHTDGSHTHAARSAVGALAPHADSDAGVWSRAEGGATSREAAGLVISKTSPKQTQNPDCLLSFDKKTTAQKRLKRLRANVWLSGHMHEAHRDGFRPDVTWFVTMTYAKADQWRPNHIAEATDAFRRWCKRRGVECRYTWVAELTKAGRVHYHLIAWLPQGVRMTFWDRPRVVKGKKTAPFWRHGMTETKPAAKRIGYLMKYLSKMGEFHQFPEGLRLYGMGGLEPDMRAVRTWQNLPQWVKNDHGVGDIKRFGSSLLDVTTGEILEPMYRRQFVPGGVALYQLRDMPARMYDHGAYCVWSANV